MRTGSAAIGCAASALSMGPAGQGWHGQRVLRTQGLPAATPRRADLLRYVPAKDPLLQFFFRGSSGRQVLAHVLHATRTTPVLRRLENYRRPSHVSRRPTTRRGCVKDPYDQSARPALQHPLKLPKMAPTISLTRTVPAGALASRACLRTRPFREHVQRRWIGTKYIEKLMKAEEAWAVQAEEISAGTRKNLFDELDERGFIKDVVG